MVMYRDFVTRSAKKLLLTGEVWNEQNGTVRVIAEGDESALQLLIGALHRGSLLARVDAVEVTWAEAQSSYQKFAIRY